MICEICLQEILIGDDGHEHCGCQEDCPCGCQGNIEQCSYASICIQCGCKYFGHGYCDTEGVCSEYCHQEYVWDHVPIF